MKKLLAILIAAFSVCVSSTAQRADFNKVARQIDSTCPFIANITLTRHDTSTGKDVVTKGYFYCRNAKTQSMVFSKTKEMLLAQNNEYTMVKDGKQRTVKANGKGVNPFETINEIFSNAITGNTKSALSQQADVKLTKQGHILTVSITPKTSGFLAKLKSMYKSCTLTIDLSSSRISSLVINERGKTTAHYEFSNFKSNVKIADKAFDVKQVL